MHGIYSHLHAHYECGLSNMDAFDTSCTPHLNDYVFAEKLGCGTYANVYKAYKKVLLIIQYVVLTFKFIISGTSP